jgi:crossover junction endodeoxyribonuclease RuvC
LIILGIDPGSLKTGYAFIEQNGRKFNHLHSGTLKFDQSLPFIERIHEIREKFLEILQGQTINEVALESLIYVKSPTALIKLAQARGVLLSALSSEGVKNIFEYSPNLIKSSTVGHGHADKQSVQKQLKMIFGIENFKTDDESDAIAVALCHGLNRGTAREVSKVGKSKTKGLAASVVHRLK